MTIILGILGLSLIVFIHELGHYIAARISGVTVEAFSIGMGPVLYHKKIGVTDYRVSLIPIGGYCAMKGQKDFQLALDEKLEAIKGDPDSFYGGNPLKRIFISLSGPCANMIFACLAFAVISMIGYTFYTTPSKIILANEVYPEIQSNAQKSGLLTGDRILSINGKPVSYFSEISEIITLAADETLEFVIDRDGEILTFFIPVQLDTSTGAGKIGVVNWVEPHISYIEENSPASKAGFLPDDKIIFVNDAPIKNTVELQRALLGLSTANVSVLRNNTTINLFLEIPYTEDNKAVPLGIQFSVLEIKSPTYSFFPALIEGSKEAFKMLGVTIKSIGLLFKGVDAKQAVSGPIRITVMLGDTVKTGFAQGASVGIVTALNFLALISVSLFLMNLLPIPILDGGLILFAFIELIIRRQVAPRVLYFIQFAGLAIILCIFIFALIGDVSYLLKL